MGRLGDGWAHLKCSLRHHRAPCFRLALPCNQSVIIAVAPMRGMRGVRMSMHAAWLGASLGTQACGTTCYLYWQPSAGLMQRGTHGRACMPDHPLSMIPSLLTHHCMGPAQLLCGSHVAQCSDRPLLLDHRGFLPNTQGARSEMSMHACSPCMPCKRAWAPVQPCKRASMPCTWGPPCTCAAMRAKQPVPCSRLPRHMVCMQLGMHGAQGRPKCSFEVFPSRALGIRSLASQGLASDLAKCEISAAAHAPMRVQRPDLHALPCEGTMCMEHVLHISRWQACVQQLPYTICVPCVSA